MEVCRAHYRCREYSLSILAFRLSEKLLPPLAEILEFGVVTYKDFDFLAILVIKKITHGGILDSRILSALFREGFLHLLCPGKHCADIISGKDNREKAYRSENRKTASYVVGDDKCSITLLVRKSFESAFLCVCDSNDSLCRLFLSISLFEILLDNAESNRRLCRCAGFRDNYTSGISLGNEVHELRKIFLRKIITGKDNLWITALVL